MNLDGIIDKLFPDFYVFADCPNRLFSIFAFVGYDLVS